MPRRRGAARPRYRRLGSKPCSAPATRPSNTLKHSLLSDGWPPFLIVVDVGYSIELFADFSGTGKAYVPFPDSLTHRILLGASGNRSSIRDRLRAIWLDPFALDPSRISARVTRDVAWQLANLARDLEQDHPPKPSRLS